MTVKIQAILELIDNKENNKRFILAKEEWIAQDESHARSLRFEWEKTNIRD